MVRNLVSHGTNTEGQNECYGNYDGTTETGYGPGYANSCIHSDSNSYSGGNTVWYNYVTASAGTIKNKDDADTVGNFSTATESVCPKGWTLPTKKQIDNNRNIAGFNSVLGGGYGNGNLYNESVFASWWGNEAYNSARRYDLRYDTNNLFTGNGHRYAGVYIRCVSEEKTATDLTYMQDMTPQTSFWTLVNGRSYDEV